MPPLRSWHPIPSSSNFSLANLPIGISTHPKYSTPTPTIPIGDHAFLLAPFTAHSGLRYCSPLQPHQHVFTQSPECHTLNAFAALGRPMHTVFRKYVQSLFLDDTPYPDILRDDAKMRELCLVPLKQLTVRLPMQIGDYTDFYAGMHHARNCGAIFRGDANALQPNYKHIPVAYHGRASSIVVSGTPIRRPKGQVLKDSAAQDKKPVFQPTAKLDFELELGYFLCKSTVLGESVPVDQAHDHLFGVVLLNDWSARDFQAWEAVPLGPFTSKNFGTTISPWVVLADALESCRASGISHDVEVLPYLRETGPEVYNINLRASVKPDTGQDAEVTNTNARNLLWSFNQMLAHHTAGGCNVNVGDLFGSGTISSPESGGKAHGSLLEQNKGGKETIVLENGITRMFLEDGDTVLFSGSCGDADALVGWGECTGRVLPAKP